MTMYFVSGPLISVSIYAKHSDDSCSTVESQIPLPIAVVLLKEIVKRQDEHDYSQLVIVDDNDNYCYYHWARYHGMLFPQPEYQLN